MLSEEKIKLMTKLAIYEQKEGRIDLPTSKYYKSDYLSIKMINSTITVSVGYVLLLLIFVVVNAENLITKAIGMDIMSIVRTLLVSYIAVIIINGIVTYIVYSRKFKQSRENLKIYNGMLKELYAIYKKEESAEAGKFTQNLAGSQDDIESYGGKSDDRIIKD